MTLLLSILASAVRHKLEEMKPMSGGYADVNGIKLYHEIYGQGEPLVLIPGGPAAVGEKRGWVFALEKTRRGTPGGTAPGLPRVREQVRLSAVSAGTPRRGGVAKRRSRTFYLHAHD